MYLMLPNNFFHLTKTNLFGEFNQKMCKIKNTLDKANRTLKPKAVVHLDKRVWSDEQKLFHPTKVLLKSTKICLILPNIFL